MIELAAPAVPRHARPDDGFTLAELLVSAAVGLIVLSAAFSFLSVHLLLVRTLPDAADVQQRGRIAADLLWSDLVTAGAWAGQGGVGESMSCCIPVVHPRRIGRRGADPAGTSRDDVVTVVRTAPGAVPGRLQAPTDAGLLVLETGSGCVASRPVCGLREDDTLVVFDASGVHDFFVLGPPGAGAAPLLPRQSTPPQAFSAGATAVGVETRTYYFDAPAHQLRVYDGDLSDAPVIDDVVAVRFEYWGVAGVPVQARVEAGADTCWTAADGLPRLHHVHAGAGMPEVRLAIEDFQDGPWCGAGENRFDADLLRIRRVRARLRMAAGSALARGTGAAFLVPGGALSALRLVPDFEVAIDVAPVGFAGGD